MTTKLCQEVVDCSCQVEEISKRMDDMQSDVKRMREMLEAWDNAKGFVVGIRTLSGVLRFIAMTAAAGGAIYYWLHGK